MNIFAAVILAAMLIEFGLDLAANMLNLRALELEPPAALKDVYAPDRYAKSQQYLREHTRFALVVSAFGLAVLLAFWFTGGFNWLDLLVRSWGFGAIANGLLYAALLGLAYYIITLPFGVYSTFVIEQRYGFNRTSPGTFMSDRLKGLALTAALGAPLFAAILALFEFTGAFAWVYCWGAVTAYLLIIEFIAPNWIMPLFNKFTPLPEGELRTAILDYVGSVNFPVRNVFVMDGSRRSSRSNAFFIGFGRNKRIALFDTLIAQHTVPELVSVLAHEIGHYKKKHIIQGLLIGIVHSGLLLFLLSVFTGSAGLYQAFGMSQHSIYAGIIFFGLLYTPLEMVISILLNMLSRSNEAEADRFAASTISDPRSIADALKKLAANNLSNLTPHPLYAFLYYSHPPLLERTRAIEAARQRSASS